MHCLFFDVRPKPGHMEYYFAHVDRLKPRLAAHKGLLYLERFRPLHDPEALLSHQLWQDEAAIQGWRQDTVHRASQKAGRQVHFEGYRIRVGPQLDLASLPDTSGRLLVASYGDAHNHDGGQVFESVTRPGFFMTLTDTINTATAGTLASAARLRGAESVRIFQINRDYTMTERTEAPKDDSHSALDQRTPYL